MDKNKLKQLVADRNRVKITWELFQLILESYLTGGKCSIPPHAQVHIIKEVCKLPDEPAAPDTDEAKKAIESFLAKAR